MDTLEISKDFNCSKEKLYKAWTEPDQLKQWWQPLGNKLTAVKNEIKQGGELCYKFENNGLFIDGAYEKAEADLLEYSWNWHMQTDAANDATYKLSVHFNGDDEHASLNIKQDGFKNEEYIKPHQQGWDAALEQLKKYLGGNTQKATCSPQQQKQHPPISGYMETPEQQKVGGG